MPEFRVTGHTVELYRFSVDCTNLEKDNCPTTVIGKVAQEVMYFVDRHSADLIAAATNLPVIELDIGEYEWMDGITVHNVDDPIAAVMRAYEMGETAYKAQLVLTEKSRNEQLRADLDYVMLMGGL